MPNFIVSYDLNRPSPTHAEMDAHLVGLGYPCGRLAETVWYFGFPGTRSELYQLVNSVLSTNDRVLVAEAVDATFRNLLVDQDAFIEAWNRNR